MPQRVDELKKSFESEFFSETISEVAMVESPPVNQVRSTVADNRQILNIIFLIDVSGSMRGQRIAMVNNALENIIKELRTRDDLNAVMKIAVLEFSEEAEWITPQPIPVQDYVPTQIKAQPWLTNYGPAFDALNQKLSRSAFLNTDLGEYFAPLILFVTDGEPSDMEDFPAALKRLKHNGWFQSSAKYSIAVGDDARKKTVTDILTMFSGAKENVRFADEGEALCSLIEYIAIRASVIATSMVSNAGDKPQEQQPSVFSGIDESLFSELT